MYGFAWKLLVWPVAALSAVMVGLDAWLLNGETGATDRFMGSLVWAVLAAGAWLMIITTMRRLAGD